MAWGNPLNGALAIFGRYPRLGEVKTRLQPFLGAEACLSLHQALLLDTAERTACLSLRRFLYLSACSRKEGQAFVQEHGLPSRLELGIQRGNGLGERLWKAYQDISSQCDRVIFVGSDSPTLPTDFIEEAFLELERFPVVLGPAEDGGYYLIGLSRPRRDLFLNIEWGTGSVLEQTRAKLDPDEYSLLPSWYDIDTVEDLTRLNRDLEQNPADAPRRTHDWIRSIYPTFLRKPSEV